jgi:FMN phosphatase YigB (HAD superfamily)
MTRWVCFDVGETLFDERGFWDRWADWLGVPRAAFRVELARIIAAGRHHREVFDHFRPGFDVTAAQAARLAAGHEVAPLPEELFPDVRHCFGGLRETGMRIAVAGNTSVLWEHAVLRAGLGQDVLASSARWQVAKPEPAFFARLAEACSARPADMAYVGDRLDNDALPAVAAGMAGIWLRRGLWAGAQRGSPEAARASAAIDSLAELPAVLARLWA